MDPKYIGEQVTSLEQLDRLAQGRRAVICTGGCGFAGRKPASFMINLNGAVLLRLFRSGMYVYEGKSRVVDRLRRHPSEVGTDFLRVTGMDGDYEIVE